MTIGPIHQSARSLTFKVIDDVRQCSPLENILRDVEGAGTYFAGLRLGSDGIASILLPRGEICGPVNAISPARHRTIASELSPEDYLAAISINQRKLVRIVR